MCCITTIFLVFSSRLAILIWWLTDPQRFTLAFNNWFLPLPVWLWTLLGGILLPWTTLAYLVLFPGGIEGYKWLVLAIALLVDLVGHGGGYHHRHRAVPFC
ncbi:MAG: hypothetical protein ABSA51_03635 [Anaerolineaceae bacterium]|jgi:hypothetical protein